MARALLLSCLQQCGAGALLSNRIASSGGPHDSCWLGAATCTACSINFWWGDERSTTSFHKDPFENLYIGTRQLLPCVAATPQMFLAAKALSCAPLSFVSTGAAGGLWCSRAQPAPLSPCPTLPCSCVRPQDLHPAAAMRRLPHAAPQLPAGHLPSSDGTSRSSRGGAWAGGAEVRACTGDSSGCSNGKAGAGAE